MFHGCQWAIVRSVFIEQDDAEGRLGVPASTGLSPHHG